MFIWCFHAIWSLIVKSEGSEAAFEYKKKTHQNTKMPAQKFVKSDLVI